ncbi:MAG: deoxyribose-phosphate aldolase [Candidatus Caenarcaniphilales bacterium]|nr:deoxyribose-phosphate aldolase [Candidatus Caenarcaniphilales bacterium]
MQENKRNINSYIDHTLLSPLANENDVEKLCGEVIKYQFRAACIQPKWVPIASFLFRQTGCDLATVADFPFGASHQSIRLKQVEHYILDGANEIDLVAPLDRIKAQDWISLFQDIRSVAQLVGTRAKLKVIIEVSLLTDEEIIHASETCAEAGCHMIKTSTGFTNTRPTQLSDIKLIQEGLKEFPEVQIKASAGIKTEEQALKFIESGVHRIGTSSALKIIGAESS